MSDAISRVRALIEARRLALGKDPDACAALDDLDAIEKVVRAAEAWRADSGRSSPCTASCCVRCDLTAAVDELRARGR